MEHTSLYKLELDSASKSCHTNFNYLLVVVFFVVRWKCSKSKQTRDANIASTGDESERVERQTIPSRHFWNFISFHDLGCSVWTCLHKSMLLPRYIWMDVAFLTMVFTTEICHRASENFLSTFPLEIKIVMFWLSRFFRFVAVFRFVSSPDFLDLGRQWR